MHILSRHEGKALGPNGRGNHRHSHGHAFENLDPRSASGQEGHDDDLTLVNVRLHVLHRAGDLDRGVRRGQGSNRRGRVPAHDLEPDARHPLPQEGQHLADEPMDRLDVRQPVHRTQETNGRGQRGIRRWRGLESPRIDASRNVPKDVGELILGSREFRVFGGNGHDTVKHLGQPRLPMPHPAMLLPVKPSPGGRRCPHCETLPNYSLDIVLEQHHRAGEMHVCKIQGRSEEIADDQIETLRLRKLSKLFPKLGHVIFAQLVWLRGENAVASKGNPESEASTAGYGRTNPDFFSDVRIRFLALIQPFTVRQQREVNHLVRPADFREHGVRPQLAPRVERKKRTNFCPQNSHGLRAGLGY